MNDLEQYLIRAKLNELESAFAAKGYAVQTRDGPDQGYDLLVTKGDEKIAIQVKAATRLKQDKDQIRRYRERWSSEGYEYRLVIARPPSQVDVEIAGLEAILTDYLLNNIPNELDDISSHTLVDDVVDVEITGLLIDAEQIRVKGTGYVEVTLEYGGGEERDGLTTHDGFPFEFELELDHELSITEVSKLDVDTSSFHE